MDFSIIPYVNLSGPALPMNPWPALANKAFCLKFNSGETIFYYDAEPSNINKQQGSASPNAPVFVLIHGLGDEADTWRHLIPLLNSHGFRVLAIDLPGFGRSITLDRINLKNHARTVERLIEAVIGPLGSGKSIFLAGSSMGAVVAEIVAFNSRPGAVKGLVLLDGTAPGGPKSPGIITMARLLFSRKWYRAYRTNPEGAWASLYPYYADLDAMPQADKDFLRARVMARVESPTQEDAFFATQQSVAGIFLNGISWYKRQIPLFKGKILLIWGEKDNIIPLASVNAFRYLRPDAGLELIPGAGHLPHQEKPAETAMIMADFTVNSIKE